MGKSFLSSSKYIIAWLCSNFKLSDFLMEKPTEWIWDAVKIFGQKSKKYNLWMDVRRWAMLWKMYKWASSWDYGTYHIGDQQMLRRTCASTQSRQSLRCSYTWSIEADEGSDQKLDIYPTGWLRMHVWRMSELAQMYLRNEPWYKKHDLGGLQPGKTQTSLPSLRSCSEQSHEKRDLSVVQYEILQMSQSTTKPTKWVCTQRRLRSAWASAQSDQSLPCALNG